MDGGMRKVEAWIVNSQFQIALVVNEEFGELRQEHLGFFMAFATLPFIDPDRTAKKIEALFRWGEIKFSPDRN